MSRGRGPWFYIFVAWVATLLTGLFIVGTLQAGEDFIIPAMIVVGIVAAVTLRGPVGQALGMRIRGETPGVPPVDESVLAELDELRARILELEERVDFSERLLSQQGEASRLPASERPA